MRTSKITRTLMSRAGKSKDKSEETCAGESMLRELYTRSATRGRPLSTESQVEGGVCRRGGGGGSRWTR